MNNTRLSISYLLLVLFTVSCGNGTINGFRASDHGNVSVNRGAATTNIAGTWTIVFQGHSGETPITLTQSGEKITANICPTPTYCSTLNGTFTPDGKFTLSQVVDTGDSVYSSEYTGTIDRSGTTITGRVVSTQYGGSNTTSTSLFTMTRPADHNDPFNPGGRMHNENPIVCKRRVNGKNKCGLIIKPAGIKGVNYCREKGYDGCALKDTTNSYSCSNNTNISDLKKKGYCDDVPTPPAPQNPAPTDPKSCNKETNCCNAWAVTSCYPHIPIKDPYNITADEYEDLKKNTDFYTGSLNSCYSKKYYSCIEWNPDLIGHEDPQ
jgi:hypothetical protein